MINNNSNNLLSFGKIALLFLIILSLSGFSTAQKENDLTENKLSGKVKSFIEISYEAIEYAVKIQKGERKRENANEDDFQNKYNEQGNLIERNVYNSDGNFV